MAIDKTPIENIPVKGLGDKHFFTEFNTVREFLIELSDEINSNIPDRIIQIGSVTTNSNKVYLALPPELKNEVVIDGVNYFSNVEQTFSFTPVTTGIKVLILEAQADSQVFYLVEGTEAPEAIEPSYNGLFVARIIVNTEGSIIENDNSTYKEREEDGWVSVSVDDPVHILSYVSDLNSSFHVFENLVGGVIGGVRNGIINRLVSPFWDGKEFWIYNATGEDLELNSENVTETDVFLLEETAILKDKQSCKLKLRRDTLEIVGVSGGSSFPEVGNDGDVLQKSGTNTVWGSIIKGVEFLGNAWLKLKIISFQGYTIAQKNAIASPVEGMLIYQNEAPKGFQKYENGAWTALGNNISNADLSNVSARTFTQGNAFTWNTGGFGYFWKGLVDKTGQANYTKVVVVHPTTGETVTRDFADPQATTLAVQNANTTQKTAMRTALLGVATPANPVLSAISPRFIERGKATYVDMLGLNLLLLDPAFIWIEKTDGTKVYATNFSNISNTVVSTQWTLPIDLPLGDYYVKIQNGFTVQGLSTALFTVTDVISSVSLLAIDWKRKLRLMPDGVTEYGIGAGTNTSTTNYVRTLDSEITGFNEINQLTWPAVVYKSQNIFPGNKDWDITINSTYLSGSGGSAPFFPYMGITETSHTGFTNINALSNIISVNSGARYLQIGNSGPTVDLASNPNYIIYISKVGSVIYLRFMFSNKTSLIYTQTSVDTSKDYAFFVQAAVTQAGRFVKMENTIFARIIE